MNTGLLLKLADMLERPLPKGMTFDMGTFSTTPGIECGTAACAIGYAAMSDEFPGLSMDIRSDHVSNHIMPVAHEDGEPRYGFDAAVVVFGLTGMAAIGLFDSSSYSGDKEDITPQRVARRIRSLIAKNGA